MIRSLAFGDVSVGDALPPLEVPLTAAVIVGGALASRDYTPVHHDAAAARAQGMQDVFMNILTTNGYFGRYVTDWAGPKARVTALSVKLGAPNVAGDTMKLHGAVVSADAASGEIEVEVEAKNAWGNHAQGKVRVALPKGA